jgi:glutaredoxin-like YruB-family protein
MMVKIYSTPWCPYCKMAKDFLEEHNIKFEDINVQEKPEKAEEMIKVSGQKGVPVITINGKVILGFNLEALKNALKIK